MTPTHYRAQLTARSRYSGLNGRLRSKSRVPPVAFIIHSPILGFPTHRRPHPQQRVHSPATIRSPELGILDARQIYPLLGVRRPLPFSCAGAIGLITPESLIATCFAQDPEISTTTGLCPKVRVLQLYSLYRSCTCRSIASLQILCGADSLPGYRRYRRLLDHPRRLASGTAPPVQ